MQFFILLLLLIFGVCYPKIFIAKWDSPITPITADFIERTLSKAEREGGEIYILQLNTPGGLETSMRRIIQRFQQTPLVTVVFVYPPGGRAASAGALITISADIAVMSPGTNIGAAHPVKMGGAEGENQKVMEQKIIQDMLALVRSIAREKGRNYEVIEKMITESLSLTEDEALKKNVIDLIAVDINDLLRQIDGKEVKKFGRKIKVSTQGEEIVHLQGNIKEELFKIITNPTIAYLLLLIGFYGLFFELYNPGAIIPGAVGAISLLLGLYGLSLISINWLGLLLLILAGILFILELITPTFGGLTLAGIIALTLGSIILTDPDSPYGDIPMSVIITMTVASALFFFVVGRLGLKAQKRKKMLGIEELVGEEAEAISDFQGGKGKVFLHGEIWNAEGEEEIKKGDKVKVISAKGLTLKVEKLKQ